MSELAFKQLSAQVDMRSYRLPSWKNWSSAKTGARQRTRFGNVFYYLYGVNSWCYCIRIGIVIVYYEYQGFSVYSWFGFSVD